MSAPRIVKNHGVSRRVLTYMQEHADKTVTLERAAADLGYDKTSISNAISYLREKHEPIVNAGAGMYHYTSDPAVPKNDSRIFELVGRTKDDRLIVRDEDGRLFVLTEL